MHQLIRPEIVARHLEISERRKQEGWTVLRERDAAYTALNREFGFLNAEGEATSSYARGAGTDYLARYEAIRDAFKGPYEAACAGGRGWRSEVGMTLSEFLFLDNFFDDLLRQLCERRGFAESWRLELIRWKAAIFIADWGRKENIAGVQARIADEIALFRYARIRCRASFQIGLFDIHSALAISAYRADWKRALRETFDRQRLA